MDTSLATIIGFGGVLFIGIVIFFFSLIKK